MLIKKTRICIFGRQELHILPPLRIRTHVMIELRALDSQAAIDLISVDQLQGFANHDCVKAKRTKVNSRSRARNPASYGFASIIKLHGTEC